MATYLATEGFAFTSKDGMPRVFQQGQSIEDTDPDFKGHEHLFELASETSARHVSRRHGGTAGGAAAAAETASAAPGEKRARTSPPPTPPSK